ncbi:MAG: hypothetical protein ORN57_03610, partial [Alphaproteobacteria bacterium]|nr:hypothetical protein [Alphaproteobacteria bacterium]
TTITAYDNDIGQHISYALVGDNHFSIDQTGRIMVLADTALNGHYSLVVRALSVADTGAAGLIVDNLRAGQSALYSLVVNVVDRDAVWAGPSPASVLSIPSYSPSSSPVAMFSATDYDAIYGQSVHYRFSDSYSGHPAAGFMTSDSNFTIDDNGKITLRLPGGTLLGSSINKTSYSLVVSAYSTDNLTGAQLGATLLKAVVIDVVDQPPNWRNAPLSPFYFINAAAAPGAVITMVSATDVDSPFGQSVRYRFNDTYEGHTSSTFLLYDDYFSTDMWARIRTRVAGSSLLAPSGAPMIYHLKISAYSLNSGGLEMTATALQNIAVIAAAKNPYYLPNTVGGAVLVGTNNDDGNDVLVINGSLTNQTTVANLTNARGMQDYILFSNFHYANKIINSLQDLKDSVTTGHWSFVAQSGVNSPTAAQLGYILFDGDLNTNSYWDQIIFRRFGNDTSNLSAINSYSHTTGILTYSDLATLFGGESHFLFI